MYSNQQGIDAATYEYDPQYQPQSPEHRQWDDAQQYRAQPTHDQDWSEAQYQPEPVQDQRWNEALHQTQPTQDQHWNEAQYNTEAPQDQQQWNEHQHQMQPAQDQHWNEAQYQTQPTRDQHWNEAQYQPQSTEDRYWDDGLTKHPVPRKRANYKPTPLRWYFVVLLITALMAVMGLVVWARQAMPDSDNSAIIRHKRSMSGELEARQDGSQTQSSDGNENGDSNDNGDGDDEMKADNYLGTTTYTSHVSSMVTVPGTTGKFTTLVPTTLYETVTVPPAEYSQGAYTTWKPVTLTSNIVSYVTVTKPGSVTQTVIVSESTGYTVIMGPVTPVATSAYTAQFSQTKTITMPGEVVTSKTTAAEEYVSTSTYEVTEGMPMPSGADEGTVLTRPIATSKVESVGSTTKAASTFITIGEVTITSEYTQPNPPNNKQTDAPGDKSGKNKPGDNKSDNAPPKPTVKPSAKVIDIVSVEPDKTIKKVEKVDPVTFVSKVAGGETVIVVSQQPETFVTEIGAYTTTMDVTIWGEDGLPTTTRVVSSFSGVLTTIVSSAEPTTFVSTKSAFLTTITSSGDKSTTIASTKKGKTQTLSSTTTALITVTPTVTDSDPEPTGDNVKEVIKVYKMTNGGYFVGKFLPPFLAVLLSIPARVIDLNAQLYQPFYALNLPNGAHGPNSMTLHFSGWAGFLKPFVSLSEGQPVTFFTMLIVWCTALMTPVATEAIGVKMHGNCTSFNPHGCATALGVSPTPTHALLALLALTIVLLCLLLFFLRNWETGLHANPWSVAGIASLATNREIRPQKSTERKIAKEMAEKRYGFGYFENSNGQTEYGIVLYDDAGQNLSATEVTMGTLAEVDSPDSLDVVRKKRRGNPFIALGIVWRLCFMLFLAGLMALVLFYGITFKTQDNFQGFMTSQTFGIRFMFAVLGVIISFGWTALFISVAMIVPYHVMSQSPQSPSNSVLLTRPTNAFSGIWSALKHGQPFPALVALMTILSEFMPILLANIPYTITQTEITHNICLYLSVVIMGFMVAALIVSFFVRWPHMPVDPRSIAGAMYYVSESGMLDHFSGMASMDNKEREQRVREIGGRYWYGEVLTTTGATRPAVERDDGTHDEVVGPAGQSVHDIDTSYHGYQS
ncbi:hypothetical protein AK830_g6658 [Neonectria ditissima]|uniref:Zonadhesin n=1 Tax=Neonectria ditissima TaxID=78410 RepID=A0A0P7BI05_9HYPO|nr:hypothetical protein AK830_g6658 [Neonectria ditissima]